MRSWDGQHVAEHAEPVGSRLEVARRDQVDRGEVGRVNDVCRHERLPPDGHPVVDHERRQVQQESDPDDDDAGDVCVGEREDQQRGQRRAHDDRGQVGRNQMGGRGADCPEREEGQPGHSDACATGAERGARHPREEPDQDGSDQDEHVLTLLSRCRRLADRREGEISRR